MAKVEIDLLYIIIYTVLIIVATFIVWMTVLKLFNYKKKKFEKNEIISQDFFQYLYNNNNLYDSKYNGDGIEPKQNQNDSFKNIVAPKTKNTLHNKLSEIQNSLEHLKL